jgi:arylsulfatase A-like enzyme
VQHQRTTEPTRPARRESLTRLSLPILLLGCGACGPPAAQLPNVLLISLDSVRADELSFRDNTISPRMTELARAGTTFRRTLSGSSWTLPAHVQMFTGQPPSLHGVQIDQHKIDAATRTLPECLRDAGYYTAGIWSGWYLAGEYGYARGMTRYDCAMTLNAEAEQALADARQVGGQVAQIAEIRREQTSHRDITSQRIVERARVALGEVSAEDPVFLFAHFFDPHYDYTPPAPYDTAFDPEYDGPLDGRDFWSDLRIFDATQTPPRQIEERDLEHIRALYRGEIAWTDQAVGQLLDAFEEAGRLDNTIVIITADHGEEFFEHGNRGHRQSLYEEVLRVPLLIVPPANAHGTSATCDMLTSLSDLMPTILEMIGQPLPKGVYGRSLVPLLTGKSLPARPLLSSLAVVGRSGTETSSSRVMECLTTENEKLTRVLSVAPDGSATLEQLAFTDLASDPGEMRPRVNPANARLRATWDALEAESSRMRQFQLGLERSPAEERRTNVKTLFAAELGALGYAEGGEVDANEYPLIPWSLSPLPPIPYPVRD